MGDENYNKNSTKCEFTLVEPAKENTPIALDIVTDETYVGMTVTVSDAATGLVKFQVSGTEEYIVYSDVIDGKAILEDVLTVGDYSVIATYMGDSRFNTNITYGDFTIKGHIKKDTPISANVDVIGNRVTLTVNVDENATGFVKLAIGGTITNIEVVDGVAKLSTTLPANSYFVDVTYLGDDDFNMNNTKVIFTVTEVSKLDTPIDLNVITGEDVALILVDLDKAATGLVKFYMVCKETGENYTMYMDVVEGHVETFTNSIEPGNYTVVATYMGDSVFNTNTTYKDVEIIGHVMKDTPIDATVEINANRVTLTVKVDENATGFVEVKSADSVSNIALENGVATLAITLPYGSYSLDITYLGDENYNKNSTKREFTLVEPAKENTPISLDVFTEENNVTITATVDEAATGLVKFQVTGEEEYTLYVDVIDGEAVLEDILLTGDYTVVATYMGDNRFNTNITFQDFTIVGHIKKDTPISASAVVNGNRVTLTVNVDENATGFVKLTVGGTVANIELTDGVATLTTTLLANSYFVDVTYLGDDNYNPNATKLTFTIVDALKQNTPISLDVETAENNVAFKVNVNETATGIVKFQVTGTEEYTLYVDVIDGVAVLEDVLKSGNYTVIAIYMGDSVFNSNLTLKEFTITEKQKSGISVDVPRDVKVGDNTTVEVSIPNATGNVSVIVDGVETVVALDENGTASIPVNNVAAGEHSIVVIYSGDDTHDSAYKMSNFTVSGCIATEFANITIMEDLNITAVLVDAKGNPVPNVVVTYVIDNVSKSTVTGADGSFTIKGVTGEVIVFNYAGNDIYLATNTSIKFDNVAPERLATQFNVTNGYRLQVYTVDYKAGERGAMFDVLLTDSNGNRLVNQSVVFAIKGWVHNKTTDENGVAHLQINLQDANKYTCAPFYIGNTTYNATFASAVLLVVKKPITITAKAKTFKASTKTKKYTVTLKTIKGSSANGKTYLSAGKKVTLKINGKTYTAKTNAKGQATFKITKLTKKGKFQTLIKFAGDNTYKAVSKKVKITIK